MLGTQPMNVDASESPTCVPCFLYKTLRISTLLPEVIYYLHRQYYKHTRSALQFFSGVQLVFHVPQALKYIKHSCFVFYLHFTNYTASLYRAVLLQAGEGLFTLIMQDSF